MISPAQKNLLIIPLSGTGIIITTVGIMLYLQGYRINLNRQKDDPIIKTTGIISVVSFPKSAAIYLNERLQNTTDSTLTLDPGDYSLKIQKDGYLPWQKNYKVKAEIVFTTNATLFKSVPDIQPATLTGALNSKVSPDGTMVLYSVNKSTTPKDNGLYRYQTNTTLSLIKNNPEQLSENLPNIDWSKATFEISPNNRQAIAYIGATVLLLDLDQKISSKNITDISLPQNLSKIRTSWKELDKELLLAKLNKLPTELHSLVSTQSANSLLFNSQNNKVIYRSDKSGSLPTEIKTSLPAKSTQTQKRDIQPDYYYIYDIQDDTNFLLGSTSDIKNLSWIPDTDNLIFTQNNLIFTTDYDTTNKQKVYATQTNNISTFTMLSDGRKLLILTAPFAGAEENLYTITIR